STRGSTASTGSCTRPSTSASASRPSKRAARPDRRRATAPIRAAAVAGLPSPRLASGGAPPAALSSNHLAARASAWSREDSRPGEGASRGKEQTMGRTYNVIDADGHVLEPLDLWEKYMDPAYRDRAPRLIIDTDGKERLLIEGKILGSPKG